MALVDKTMTQTLALQAGYRKLHAKRAVRSDRHGTEDLIHPFADAFQYISYHPLDYIKGFRVKPTSRESPAARTPSPDPDQLAHGRREGHRPDLQDTGIGMVFIVGMNVTWRMPRWRPEDD